MGPSNAQISVEKRKCYSKMNHMTLEEKTVLNDYATTTKTVHNDSFSVVFQSLWTVLVIVG
jgi:hypothetical protein